MKSFISISLAILLSFTFVQFAHAQKTQESLNLFKKAAQARGLNVNSTLSQWEKQLIPVLNSRFPSLNVTAVSINKTTGEISVKGTNSNGTLQTLPGSNASSGGSSNSIIGSVFDWWYDVEGRKNNIGPNGKKAGIEKRANQLDGILDEMGM